MIGSNENVARGNARVGVQAGIVFGGIQQPPVVGEPADVLARIDALRAQLRRAQADDRLDEPTYKAAEAELTIAADALATGTADARGTGLVALKRLRGLVIDLSDLAAGVAAVIAVIQGLS